MEPERRTHGFSSSRTAQALLALLVLEVAAFTASTLPGVFLASAATPPGPAVHGQCGDNAARVALREVFGVREVPPLRPAVT